MCSKSQLIAYVAVFGSAACLILSSKGVAVNLTLRSSWPGVPRGPAFDVAVVSNRAYLALGPNGVVVYDITDPAQPTKIGAYKGTNSAESIQISGHRVWILDTSFGSSAGWLEVIDFSNPVAPVRVGQYQTEGPVFDWQVLSNRAYLAGLSRGLDIVDFSNPQNPVRIGRYSGNIVGGVHVIANLAYLAVADDGLEIVDVSNPVSPTKVGSFDAEGYTRRVHVHGNYAYLSVRPNIGSNTIQIVDVSQVSNPVAVDGYRTSGSDPLVRILGDHAYVLTLRWSGTDYVGNLEIVDLTVPFAPVQLATVQMDGFGTSGVGGGLDTSGDHVYVTALYGGLHVVNVTNRREPFLYDSAATSGFASHVQVAGNYAFLDDGFSGMEILDVSRPGAPTKVSRVDTEGWSDALYVHGRYAYLANYPGVLRIIDIANVSNPVVLTSYDLPGPVSAIHVKSNHAYFVGFDLSGVGYYFRVLDVAQPANPAPVGSLTLPHGALALKILGDYAYLAWDDEISDQEYLMLSIVNISQPTNPVLVSTRNLGRGEEPGMHVVGRYAYIAATDTALRIVDISNPVDPVTVGAYGTNRIGLDVRVEGTYAYLAGRELERIDVADPANPVRVATVPLPGGEQEGVGLEVVGNNVYVADGFWGLHVFEVTTSAITSIARLGNQAVVHWNGAPTLKLQRSGSLSNPFWTDVPGSEGQSMIAVPVLSQEFFRLVAP